MKKGKKSHFGIVCSWKCAELELDHAMLKLMFSKKATKIDEIFTADLTLTKCQMDGENLVHICGLLIKHELQETF